jgi:hypothetical protein
LISISTLSVLSSPVVDSVKRSFHRDLSRDPVTHGWVLNLYRAGERYPQRVCDYFQLEFAPWTELAADLDRHALDEARHVTLFEHGLAQLRQPVVELPSGDVFNEVIRSFTPGTFHIVDSDPPDRRSFKLANFLAHAHHLEKRIARSFAYHLDACEAVGQERVGRMIASIHRDEEHHVRYTREAIFELLPRSRALEVMAVHRRAEAKANLVFSARQVAALLGRCRNAAPRHHRLLYKLSSYLMEGAGHLV